MSKLKIASAFVQDSPPGEMNDVINDIRSLMNDDEALQSGILPALRQHNKDQFICAAMPGQDYEVVISKYGEISEDVFLDPRSKQKFTFDHAQLKVLTTEHYDVDENVEPLRSAIDGAVEKYITDHFPKGAYGVFASEGKIAICIVSNKYNPNNYWNGRWRSCWEYTPGESELTGTFKVHVHYYEDGNVQLNTTKEVTTMVDNTDDDSVAKSIIERITSAEGNYQNSINESFMQLSEGTFKALRRNLPMTRNKLDWNKVLSYKLGAELANKS